jgi:hypothetical protein
LEGRYHGTTEIASPTLPTFIFENIFDGDVGRR